MKASIRIAIALAMVLAAVGGATHEIQAQSKKATTPVKTPQTFGPVIYTPPPEATANLMLKAPTGNCYELKDCPAGQGNPGITQAACQRAKSASWKETSPNVGSCINF